MRPARRTEWTRERLGTLGLALVGGGVALAVVGRLGGKLTGGSSSQLGWKQGAALGAGIALAVGGTALMPLSIRSHFRDRAALPRWPQVVLIAGAALLLVWALLISLDQSLGHDEAYSALNYTSGGPREILAGDYVPNDHVLFNLLAWVMTSAVGESEISYRFWSVLPTLVAAATITWWSWVRLGRWVAVAVALLVATSPVVFLLGREARGYGLAFIAGVIMLICADRFGREQTGRSLLGFSAAGFVGAATLPVFAIAFVGQALPLMVLRRTRVRVAAAVGAVGVALLILYAPLVADIVDAAGQQFGRRLPWHGPLSTAATDLLGPSVQVVFRSDLPPELPNGLVAGDNAIAGAIALIGALLLWRTGERMLTALLVVPTLFTYSILTVADFFVEPRFAAFLLFHMIVLAGCGIVGVIKLIPVRSLRGVAAAGAAVVAASAIVHGMRIGDALHDLPSENFKDAAEVVRARGGSRVLTDSTRPQGLQYYLGVANVVQLPPAELEARFCFSNDPVLYVDHPFRGSPHEARPPSVRCLKRRGAERVRLRQRDRGGRIDVWALTP